MTKQRPPLRLFLILVAVLGTLISTATVASAVTLAKRAASSGLAVASVAETRVGVATIPAPLLVAQQSIVSPGQVGQNCPRFLTIVSGSCVATKPGAGAADDLAGLTASERKAVDSLGQRSAEHQVKLDAYRANPDAFDNQGFLKNAPSDAVRQRIIDGRIRHLEQEIKTFQDQIRKIMGGKK